MESLEYCWWYGILGWLNLNTGIAIPNVHSKTIVKKVNVGEMEIALLDVNQRFIGTISLENQSGTRRCTDVLVDEDVPRTSSWSK